MARRKKREAQSNVIPLHRDCDLEPLATALAKVLALPNKGEDKTARAVAAVDDVLSENIDGSGLCPQCLFVLTERLRIAADALDYSIFCSLLDAIKDRDALKNPR